MVKNICGEKTFKELYYEHSEYLRNFLFYKSGNLQLSEDIMQDAFAKMWENCAKVTSAKARSYVFTIANNLFLNKANRAKLHFNFVQKSTTKKNNQDPQYLLEEKEFKSILEQAIADLPQELRIVFLMNRIDKKKYREIAEELDLSVKAIEKRMHKALIELRRVYKNI